MKPELEEVLTSDRLWTGIAIVPGEPERIFVNYPRWCLPDVRSHGVPVSVAEVFEDGSPPSPFPLDSTWNDWNDTKDPRDHFVCVQSVTTDKEGYLYVLDSGNPCFAGVIPGAPKLLKFNTNGDLELSVYYQEPEILPHSYLNDVRIDTKHGMAYLTDSGEGALIATELASRKSRRLLAGHDSVMAEKGFVLCIDGKAWCPHNHRRVHSDGIALSPDGEALYFHALQGRTLNKVPTADCRNAALTPKDLRVERVTATGAADAMECTRDGTVYVTSLEEHAVKCVMPDKTAMNVVKDDNLLQWPDALAVSRDGCIYVTTSRIHLGNGPYGLFRFKPPQS